MPKADLVKAVFWLCAADSCEILIQISGEGDEVGGGGGGGGKGVVWTEAGTETIVLCFFLFINLSVDVGQKSSVILCVLSQPALF